MEAVLRKSAMMALLMFALMLVLIFSENNAYATTEGNLALNPSQTGYPQVSASYTCDCDSVWSTVNGIFSFGNSPRDRWTNYGSPNASDWLEVDFGSAQTFNRVKLYLYNDGGGVTPPASYAVQYWNGGSWTEIPGQTKNPAVPAAGLDFEATPGNTLNTVDFNAVASPKIRIVFSNSAGYSGLVELEVLLYYPIEDVTAASAVTALIDTLPLPPAASLADKPAIAAARAAYEQLTAVQKSLVANVAKLTAAEAAITSLEASLADIAVLSAFGNAAGNEITFKLSSVVDATYGIKAPLFAVSAGGAHHAVTSAVYDPSDPSGKSIKLVLSSPVLLNETDVSLSIQSGAITTANHKLNNAIVSFPVVTFHTLDVTRNGRIGVDDIVEMIGNPLLHIDVNRDGVFRHEDITSLLGRISTRS